MCVCVRVCRACVGDETLYNYFLQWQAWKCLHPYDKTGVCIIMTSEQGCGKGMWVHRFLGQRLFGSTYAQITNLDHITGRFNSILLGKCIINLDESTVTDRQGASEITALLKNLITEDSLVIEQKCKDQFYAPSFFDMIMTTNSTCPVRVEPGDRRFFVLHVSSQYKNNHDYFQTLLDIINAADTPVLYYRHLLQIADSNFNPRAMPVTTAKQEMQSKARSKVAAFLQHICMQPSMLDLTVGSSDIVVSKKAIHQAYISYMRTYQTGYPKVLTDQGCFAKELRQELGAAFVARSTTSRQGETVDVYKLRGLQHVEERLRSQGLWDLDQYI